MVSKGYNQNLNNPKDPYSQIIGLQEVFVLASTSEASLASVKEITREEIQATTHEMLGIPIGEAY